MSKLKTNKNYYKIKIVLLMILWCFSSSFMETCVNSFFASPDLLGLICSIPLIYATYKCIIEIVKNAFIIKTFEYVEKENDGKSE